MKIISICKKCKGTGNITAYKFIKKTCPVCNGSGKVTKHLSDFKKEERNKFFLHSSQGAIYLNPSTGKGFLFYAEILYNDIDNHNNR